MKKKRNKKYIQQYFNSNPIDSLIYRKQKMSSEQATTLGIHSWINLEQIKTNPSAESFYNLSSIVRSARIAVDMGFSNEIPEINIAIDGFNRAYERQKETGSYALDGETLAALPAVIELREEQIRTLPRETLLSLLKFQQEKRPGLDEQK